MNKWIAIVGGLLAGSVAGNIWSVWRVLRPVRSLAASAERLAQGDMTALEQGCGGIRDIANLRQSMASMAGHVQRAQAEGLTYRHALTDGQEAERARIAHELHDDTVQSLVAIAQCLELAATWIDTDPQRARTMLITARTQAVQSVESLRHLIADLRPPALEELGISAALRLLAASAGESQVQVSISGDERRIGQAPELALFRIAQEAVRNAEKHGQPRHITLSLTYAPHDVRLIVADDGSGFTPPAALDGLAQRQHFGLLGMQERVQQLNGTLTLRSRPGAGTVVDVILPLDVGAQPVERVRDPVCGAVIEPQRAFSSTVYHGERYFFCCPVCQGAFQRQPETYIAEAVSPTR
ncbi:MAG: histidine kinase [bacterium]|nr:histidine kinase [bacterium]